MTCIEEVAGLSTEGLEREIAELGGHINAATARWLGLVGEFDRREGWAEWGCRSCTHWLSYRCGVSPAAAREQVRVARRVAELPALQAAFSRGELCYSQVRAVTRVATPDTEADLLEIALHATASHWRRSSAPTGASSRWSSGMRRRGIAGASCVASTTRTGRS